MFSLITHSNTKLPNQILKESDNNIMDSNVPNKVVSGNVNKGPASSVNNIDSGVSSVRVHNPPGGKSSGGFW